MLRGDEIDLLAFFCVEPRVEEAYRSFDYEVSKDGLRLLVTIYDVEGAVYVSIFRDGLPDAVFTVRRNLCTHFQIGSDKLFQECFEAGSPAHPVSDPAIKPVLVRGVRVYVEPQFKVELIEDRWRE